MVLDQFRLPVCLDECEGTPTTTVVLFIYGLFSFVVSRPLVQDLYP